MRYGRNTEVMARMLLTYVDRQRSASPKQAGAVPATGKALQGKFDNAVIDELGTQALIEAASGNKDLANALAAQAARIQLMLIGASNTAR